VKALHNIEIVGILFFLGLRRVANNVDLSLNVN
jgi:hypothetical protein